MRIASITMVGQFPHGIDLHVRNLRSMLTEDDHLDWTRLRPASRDALQRIARTGGRWLPPPSRDRLLRLQEVVAPAT